MKKLLSSFTLLSTLALLSAVDEMLSGTSGPYWVRCGQCSIFAGIRPIQSVEGGT